MSPLMLVFLPLVATVVASNSSTLAPETETTGDRTRRRLEIVDVDNVDEHQNTHHNGGSYQYIPPAKSYSGKVKFPSLRDSQEGDWRPIAPVRFSSPSISFPKTPSYAEPLAFDAYHNVGIRVPAQDLRPPPGAYSVRDAYRTAGPSSTAPFWEDIRSHRPFVVYPGHRDPLGCHCGAVRLTGSTSDLDAFRLDLLRGRHREGVRGYRLGPYGIGAYGLYGWNEPRHHHNSVPLGVGLGHDSPN